MNTDKIKKFIWDENKPPVFYRVGTSDEEIIKAILVDQQEYSFPAVSPKFDPKIVFDIGGNIGVVAVVLASIYPKAQIFSFEPMEDNFYLLQRNTESYKNVHVFNYGLGKDTGSRTIWHSDDGKNLGGFSIEIKSENSELIELREVSSVIQELGVPDVIKIDVEGAEAEIFEYMPNLGDVKWIAGELHGVRDFHVLDLLSKHFHIQCARDFQDKCWHFHAINRTLINPPPQS